VPTGWARRRPRTSLKFGVDLPTGGRSCGLAPKARFNLSP
jgi:hypothetical protein